ncbi:MAG: protoporphyrinogen oxidase [Proteobacteria bacterium]|nr:protoporphyrinogen oxidase [Pseudomonadota bacterium]
MSGADCETVVIGAGVAGLGAARELAAAGRDVHVIDAGACVGGVLQTSSRGGYRVEHGPNTLRVPGPLAAWLAERDLQGALRKAHPASRLRQLFVGGRLVPVPMGPWAFARTPLLSPRAKLRLLSEPWIRGAPEAGESVAEFIGRRLGSEAVTALVGPFLTGVYAGDEQELGAEAVFPSLVQHERDAGSIVRGALRAWRRRSAPAGLPGTWSGSGGAAGFARALADALPRPPELRTRVTALERCDSGWRLGLEGPGRDGLTAERVIVALPAHEAAALLEAGQPELAKWLRGIAYAPIAAVALGLDPAEVREPVRGFGFLVPQSEGLRMLGTLFMSQLFDDRAPAGRELAHVMLGGVRWPEAVDLDDAGLAEHATRDLDRVLGLRAEPEFLLGVRWRRAVPQPGRDHPRRVAELRRLAAAQPGLTLAGAYLDGVSVGDALLSGVRAARGL